MPDDSRHQVNLLDFFAFLLRWRTFLVTVALAVSILVGVTVFLLPPRYRSTAIIRSQESNEQGIGSLIASKLGALGGLANFATSLSEVPEEMYISILESRWLSERVIDEFNLRSVYKMKHAKIEDVIKTLLTNTRFDLDELSGNLIIWAEDNDPKRARAMAVFYVDQLDARNRELRSVAATREREFVEQRLTEERSRLTAYEDSLYSFQIATGVLNVEEQVKATIQVTAALEAQRLATQSEVEMTRTILGEANPETQYAKYKLASIDSTIQALVHSTNGGGDNFLLGLEEVPMHGMTYVRLMRDIEIQQLLVGYLLQQYEQARITELRNTPTLTRIDPPAEPTKRVWPHRGLLVVIAFLGSSVFAIAIAMLIEMFTNATKDPTHPQHAHVRNIMISWKRAK